MNQEQITKYINDVITSIFESVETAGDLLNDNKKMKLIQSISDAMERMGISLVEWMPELLNSAYVDGTNEAAKDLKTLAENALLSGNLEAAAKAEILLTILSTPQGLVQKRIHVEAVQALVEQSVLDLKAAIRTAQMNAKNNILQTLETVKKDIVSGAIQGNPRKVVKKRVMQSFLKDGMTAFYTKKDTRGRRRKLPLDFYANLVVSTKTRDAGVQGANNRYEAAGVDLVEVNGRDDTCHVCAKYRGMVFSISGETKGFESAKDYQLPPFHPNCRCTTRPFVLEFKTPTEIQKKKDMWKTFNPDKDTRTKAQKAQYDKDQEARRKANEEKKQYMRWQAVLGAENFKTIGAFRRGKRTNSPKYQELQSMVRIEALTKD